MAAGKDCWLGWSIILIVNVMNATQNSGKGLNGIVIALLSTFIIIGVAQLTLSAKTQEMVRQNTEKINKINNDYTPLFVINTIVESNNLMTQEIVGIREADKEKVKEVQKKYAELQKMVINELSNVRSKN